MTKGSEIDLFADRLDAYGPDLARWPADFAGSAEALLACSAEARALQSDSQRFARLLASAAEAPAPNGFAFRVVGEIAARREDRWFRLFGSPGRFGLASAGLCAAAVVIGVSLGLATSPTGASYDPGDAIDVAFNDVDL
ncbi:hypothetical protein [Methylopila sp. 73B]|uniref:hypothetical protein n=1 Tax=Methylopila sp. 73B TaxID=1120792 RepID=UPI0003773F01|nr:hypothetical protein [Methylopila sp. 73B]